MEVFVKPVNGSGRIGSGYRVNETAVLTAGHVVTGLPVRSPAKVTAGDEGAGRCELRALGERAWMNGSLLWRDKSADVALIGLAGDVPPLPPGSPVPRWGRVDGTEPIAVSAVGFPWAQERPDRVRDSEQLFGFIAPATTVKAGLYAVTVLTAAPADRAGGSPWAGMSGAALFAGPFLMGVVVIDPAPFRTDRVVAAPVAPLLDDVELANLLETSAEHVVGVGPRLRLAVTAETSVALAPPYQKPTPRLGAEPTRLLLPEYGIVPFLGRDNDLELLEAWCMSGLAQPRAGDHDQLHERRQAAALRVVVGAAGSGKTRLAAETCVRMTGKGWQAGFADPDTPGGRAQLEFDLPTLLVVDDADLKASLPWVPRLVDTVGHRPFQTPPIRLLLLARHTTGWWDTLNQSTNRLAAELADSLLMLHEGALALVDRSEHHARARAAFATHVQDPVTPAAQPPLVLTASAFVNPLVVHMHALLTVCGGDVPTTGTAVRERILDAVLDRERKRWADTFPPNVLSSGARAHHQAVAAATLLAPPTEAATARAMTVIGELASDAAAGARAAVATWLRELYTGSDPPWVASLRPDLLAEQLLASCPQLSDLVLAGFTGGMDAPEQCEQLLTQLVRAESRPPVHNALAQLLAAHFPYLLGIAVMTATSPLPDPLDLALTHCPQPEAAANYLNLLPEYSTRLAALAATMSSQAVDHYRHLASARPEAFTPDLAGSLVNLSIRLATLGRAEDALAAIEEAVALYRHLASARPEAFTPDLAGSLVNLSNRLAALDRAGEGLDAIEEAIRLQRQVGTITDLAGSLINLSNRLAALGRAEDALTAIEEAVTLHRQLAADEPRFAPRLAASLNNLSNRLAALGRAEDSFTAIKEAVALYWRLADAQPDAFTPALAESLNNLSRSLAALGRAEDSLTVIEETVTLYRRLAAARPDAFSTRLAMSLTNLSRSLASMGRWEDAQAAAREAAAFYH